MIETVALSMRSADVARAAGVNQQRLRYCERRGLLAEPPRSPGGHGLYPAEAVTVLRVIKAAQRLGFTLEEIANCWSTASTGTAPWMPGCRCGRAKLTEVEARIGDIVVIRDNLQSALAMGCGDLEACAQSDCGPLPFTGLAKDGGRCPGSAPSEG